jgi:UDP-N-acetylglucosamine 2-epimerase
MQPNQSLSTLTALMHERLNPIIQRTKPDWILAQGDTTTVLVAALETYYHRVRFGHIEAGLRTGDRYQPFPEEMNRQLADVLSDLLFAPTERSRQALLREGVPEDKIKLVGNTVIDALLATAALPYDWANGPLAKIPQDKRLVLITAHRRESFGEPFRQLCQAIRELAAKFHDSNVQFIYPVHLNPNVQQPVMEFLYDIPGVSLIEPLDYQSLVQLMKRCELILTDSGGIQEEAPSFGVPVLVMRETTERPEGVESGVAKIVGTTTERIVAEASKLLLDKKAHAVMATKINPYGDGTAARRIVDVLLEQQ